MNNQHLSIADTVTPTIKVADAELEYLAKQYLNSAKLRQRMNFAEFMLKPNEHLESAKNWPSCVWSIDFVESGSHQKMWVTDLLSNKTIDLSVIRMGNPESVSTNLMALVRKIGAPDLVKFETTLGENNLWAVATLNTLRVKWQAAETSTTPKEVA